MSQASKLRAASARILAAVAAVTILCWSLFSCSEKVSAYDTPEKYVSLPALEEISISSAELEETYEDLMEQLLENLSDEVYTAQEDPDTEVMKGDKICIRYTGAPADDSVELSDDILASLTNSSDESGFELVVGNDEFITEIEEGAIGQKAGVPFSVTVEYTEESSEYDELIGVEIVFDITIETISRQIIDENHTVTLRYSAALANGDEPLDTLLPLTERTSETVLLSDSGAAFDSEFSVSDIRDFIIGHSPYEKVEFTITLPADRASEYGYDEDIELLFSAEITAAYKTPEELTDELVSSMTDGEYTSSEEYKGLLYDMIREDLSFQAVADAAVYADELPEDEYNEYYSDNYNAALYAALGDISSLTSEELAELMTSELTEQIETTARENATAELRERLLMEYLFKLLDITLSDEEYQDMLSQLYESYENDYYYLLYMYGISSAEQLDEYLGHDYVMTQFKYQKMLPVLAERVACAD